MIDRIFDLIKNEDAVLFVGAGLSIGAGYPTGSQLCDILYESLSETEKRDVGKSNNLSDMTEDIVNIRKSKNEMLRIVKREVTKEPISIKTHELLARIPQFKTIITTNYDTLIEANNKNIEVVKNSSQYALADKSKQLLFKIHGDFHEIDNIVLTKQDYIDFFDKKTNKVFWNAVVDRLVSKSIIFLGYNLDDNNIQSILDHIISELGDNRKEIYFVSRTVKIAKRAYLERKNIKYIELTGEEFIAEVVEDLKKNYIPNLKKKEYSKDMIQRVSADYDIGLSLDLTNNNIVGFKSLGDKELETEFTLSIKGTKEELEQIYGKLKGEDFEDVILTPEMLHSFGFSINNLCIHNIEGLKDFRISASPKYKGNVDLIFESGFEVDDIQIEVFVVQITEYKKKVKFVLYQTFSLVIEIIIGEYNRLDFSLTLDILKDIKKTNIATAFYGMLNRFFQNEKFYVLNKDGDEIYNYNLNSNFKDDPMEINTLFNYFLGLKMVEEFFKIRFRDIKIKDIDYRKLKIVLDYINNKETAYNAEDINVGKLDRKTIDNLVSVPNEPIYNLGWMDTEDTVVVFHEQEFNLGMKNYIIKDAYIVNRQELMKRSTEELIVRSSTDKLYSFFTKK